MIAYKFLAAGSLSPFRSFRWPVPVASGAGAWVEAPDERLDHGIHACRLNELAFWLDAELWRAELADPVAEGQHQVVGRRGRLVGRVSAWDEALARSFGEACIWLSRDRSVGALGVAGAERDAGSLGRVRDLAELHAVTTELSTRGGLVAALAGHVGEAIEFLEAGDAPCAAYICARVAVVAAGGLESEFAAERERQAAILAERLRL
ncbi:MAG: hypothetical protein ACJ79R_14415 [Anaeromyxobacteraceae bacterium]